MAQTLSTEKILEMLTDGPNRILALTENLTAEDLHTPPAEGEWSANDILAHLRACSDMWGECIATIWAEEEPTIRAVNPRTWIEKTDYLEQPFRKSLQHFTNQRRDLLALLEPLPAEAWDRKATIVGAGRPLERTIFFYAHWLATHERPHLKQIKRLVENIT